MTISTSTMPADLPAEQLPKLDSAWWLNHLRIREEKVVVKLFKSDGSFIDAVNIPTHMWPLSGAPEVFHWNNTQVVDDEKVKGIVDAINYRVGHCYSNADDVTKALCAAGYNAKYYVGWIFFSNIQYPLHHAWTVLDGTHIIDLAEESFLLKYNGDRFASAKSTQETRELMVEFHKWATSLPHSKRCIPFGVPAPTVLYVGCESNKKSGIWDYNELMERYPDHPCQRPKTKSGYTVLQEMCVNAEYKEEL